MLPKKNAWTRVPGIHENEFYNSLTKTYTRNLAINVPNIYLAKLIYPQI